MYIRVGSAGWMKPTWASPLTRIADDGSWVADITTGGVGSSALEVYAAIVTRISRTRRS